MPKDSDSLPDFIQNPEATRDYRSGPSDHKKSSRQFVFEDNARARELFGQFDEHLALIERELAIEAVSRGNEVTLHGDETAIDQAEQVLETLDARLLAGEVIGAADVEGVLRTVTKGQAKITVPENKPAAKPGGAASISTAT